MRLKSKVSVVVVTAVLMVGMSVATALAAAQETVALDLAGFSLSPEVRANGTVESDVTSETPAFVVAEGHYGAEVTLQPTVLSKIELPNDVFHLQVLVQDVDASGTLLPGDPVWMDFNGVEDIKLEDTNTVQPFTYALGVDDTVVFGDGTVATPVFPYTIRAEYKPAGSSSTPPSYTETETVSLTKWNSTKVGFSRTGSIRRAGTAFDFQVAHNCGIGTIKVGVRRVGSKTVTYTNVITDELGAATETIKLGSKNGTYKLTAKFLGNRYGAASKTVTKTVHATR